MSCGVWTDGKGLGYGDVGSPLRDKPRDLGFFPSKAILDLQLLFREPDRANLVHHDQEKAPSEIAKTNMTPAKEIPIAADLQLGDGELSRGGSFGALLTSKQSQAIQEAPDGLEYSGPLALSSLQYAYRRPIYVDQTPTKIEQEHALAKQV